MRFSGENHQAGPHNEVQGQIRLSLTFPSIQADTHQLPVRIRDPGGLWTISWNIGLIPAAIVFGDMPDTQDCWQNDKLCPGLHFSP